MRQFFSPRFWLALGALAGLLALLVVLFHRTTPPVGVEAATGAQAPERHLDLVSWIFQAIPATGFTMAQGVTTADMSLQLDGTRTMMIRAGTPGEIHCPGLAKPARCTVAADLLGDAVLWFSIVPGTPGPTAQLPAVVEMLDAPWVRLANDWVVRRADKVERACPADTSSLSDFIKTYGATARSTFNFESQKVVRVTCPGDGTVETLPVASGPATSVIVGTETDDTGVTTPAGRAPASTVAASSTVAP